MSEVVAYHPSIHPILGDPCNNTAFQYCTIYGIDGIPGHDTSRHFKTPAKEQSTRWQTFLRCGPSQGQHEHPTMVTVVSLISARNPPVPAPRPKEGAGPAPATCNGRFHIRILNRPVLNSTSSRPSLSYPTASSTLVAEIAIRGSIQ